MTVWPQYTTRQADRAMAIGRLCYIIGGLKRYRYSSREKFEDAFDTAIDLMSAMSSDSAFSAVFRTSINADRKQWVMSYPVGLYTMSARMSLQALVILGKTMVELFDSVRSDPLGALLCSI